MITPTLPHLDGLQVIYRDVASLTPHAQNANLHSSKQVGRIARSIKDYGWTVPLLVDEHGLVLAGHGRLLAAAKLGISQVPTITLSHMSAAQKRSYMIADNRLAEIGGTWDKQLLAREHEAIRLLDPEFDLTATGFDMDDIVVMLDNVSEVGEDSAPNTDRSRPATSRRGDLWLLGSHRLFCGNALEGESFAVLMGSDRARMVITDAPYNVRINGNCVGKGKHSEFEMASGEMTRTEFAEFLMTIFAHLISYSADGSIHYLFMDWRHMAEMVLATSQYTEQKNLIVWNKKSAGQGAFYRSQHELVWVMKNGTAKHVNNFGMGEHGRLRSNVWDYAGLNGGAPDRQKLLALHPTVKSLELISDALRDCSRKGDVVLDCFCGSGTIMVAAEHTGRQARAIELDPHYVDTAVKRWQNDTGQQATLADDGRTFDAIAKERRGQ
jgi:DNA modification methylase